MKSQAGKRWSEAEKHRLVVKIEALRSMGLSVAKAIKKIAPEFGRSPGSMWHPYFDQRSRERSAKPAPKQPTESKGHVIAIRGESFFIADGPQHLAEKLLEHGWPPSQCIFYHALPVELVVEKRYSIKPKE